MTQQVNWRETFPKLNEATQQWLFGDIWERPGLSKRDRSLITIAVNAALYRTEQLRGHVGEDAFFLDGRETELMQGAVFDVAQFDSLFPHKKRLVDIQRPGDACQHIGGGHGEAALVLGDGHGADAGQMGKFAHGEALGFAGALQAVRIHPGR